MVCFIETLINQIFSLFLPVEVTSVILFLYFLFRARNQICMREMNHISTNINSFDATAVTFSMGIYIHLLFEFYSSSPLKIIYLLAMKESVCYSLLVPLPYFQSILPFQYMVIFVFLY